MSIEKYAEKHSVIKQSKIYTQLWKNKEMIEQLGVLLNENLSEGFKGRELELPSTK
jgi:hypothetical protein